MINSQSILVEKDYTLDDGTVLSGTELIALRQFEKAILGCDKSFEFVRDTVGQKPTEKAAKHFDGSGFSCTVDT